MLEVSYSRQKYKRLCSKGHRPQARLLYGLIPETLLQDYVFWQDEDDNLRGYPSGGSGVDGIIYVRLDTGGHVALSCGDSTTVHERQHATASAGCHNYASG